MAARRLVIWMAAVFGALVTLPSSDAARRSEILVVDEVGRGANKAWIVRPTERVTSVVVFVHDRGDLIPAKYEPWIDYLALNGSAVIFPRYETRGARQTPVRTLRALHAGISAAYAHLKQLPDNRPGEGVAKVPLVVAGYSYGGSLAFYVAANAPSWGLPVPAAIDSVFPLPGRIRGLPLAAIRSSARVLIQVGDRDRVAGRTGGDDLMRYLARHPAARKRFQVVHSTGRLKAEHTAPLQQSAAVEDVFWRPLDDLIYGR